MLRHAQRTLRQRGLRIFVGVGATVDGATGASLTATDDDRCVGVRAVVLMLLGPVVRHESAGEGTLMLTLSCCAQKIVHNVGTALYGTEHAARFETVHM